MKMRKTFYSLIILAFIFPLCQAQSSGDIKLPPPQTEIGKPLMQALKTRQSDRGFSTDSLPLQEVSNILWAGFGINRRETDGRTAPSSKNIQEIEIYVFLNSGVYLYQARQNTLRKIKDEDMRCLTGVQEFVKSAPMNLVFVSDQSRMENKTPDEKNITSGLHAGSIYQNINLYCSSQNLGAVVRAMINKEELAKRLGLKSSQKIVISQTIGYKK